MSQSHNNNADANRHNTNNPKPIEMVDSDEDAYVMILEQNRANKNRTTPIQPNHANRSVEQRLSAANYAMFLRTGRSQMPSHWDPKSDKGIALERAHLAAGSKRYQAEEAAKRKLTKAKQIADRSNYAPSPNPNDEKPSSPRAKLSRFEQLAAETRLLKEYAIRNHNRNRPSKQAIRAANKAANKAHKKAKKAAAKKVSNRKRKRDNVIPKPPAKKQKINHIKRKTNNDNKMAPQSDFPQAAKDILMKYDIKNSKKKGNCIFYNLKTNYCGGNHRRSKGQNFIYYSKSAHTHSLTIKCRSRNCAFKQTIFHDRIHKEPEVSYFDNDVNDSDLLLATIEAEKASPPNYFDEDLDDSALISATLTAEEQATLINWNKAPSDILNLVQDNINQCNQREKIIKDLHYSFNAPMFKRSYWGRNGDIYDIEGRDLSVNLDIHKHIGHGQETISIMRSDPTIWPGISSSTKHHSYCPICADLQYHGHKCKSCETMEQLVKKERSIETLPAEYSAKRTDYVKTTYKLAYW